MANDTMTKPQHFWEKPDDEGTLYWARQLATSKAVVKALKSNVSPWYWIRLPDGNLVIACYPKEEDKDIGQWCEI